jgi:hypothetical protein
VFCDANYLEGSPLKHKTALLAGITSCALLITTECAASRDQVTVGFYIDDSVITSTAKSLDSKRDQIR